MSELKGIGGALKVAGVIAAVTAYARITDGVKQATAQLKLATRTQQELNRAQAEAYTIAQRNGTAYNATAILLAKNLKAANAIGLQGAVAAEKARAATSAVSAAIRVSGTNAEAAKGSLLQLGQALSSGTLRGDELNSVMEGIPAVADALAKSMGKTTGELRAMGQAGKLTSAAVLEGLAKAEPELRKLADMIPLTIGGALEKVKNSFARMLSGFDSNTSLSAGMVSALEIVSNVLDTLADHAQAVSNVVVGVLVAMGLKSAAAFRAGAAGALSAAKANVTLAASANAAAIAQQRQAVASLAVARAGGTLGAANAGSAAAQVAAASAKVATTSKALKGAELAALGASRGVGLFGRAVTVAVRVANAAIAMLGGGIGAIVMALTALVLWAGKVALGFQPIKDEAGTVGDYIAVAFEDASAWAGKKLGELSAWAGKKWQEIASYLRPVAVWIVDAFLNVGRGVAGAVQGVVAAWRAGVDNVRSLIAGLASDASSAMHGDFTTAGTTAALANSKNIGAAFGQGVQEGFNSTFKGVSGESVVGGVENFVKSIPGQISDWAKSSGYRDRANARARARTASEQGGLGAPGNPPAAAGDKDKDKKAKQETTFADILKDAQEEARLATLTTAERERQEAILAAQKTLKRDLVDGEKAQLSAAIDLKRTNEANRALEEATRDVLEDVLKARAEAAAEARRVAGDLSGAASITAEIAVQEMLNKAKRDGVVLDAAKVASYRQAVLLASQEAEVLKAQEEARRALQSIADDARNSIREAISGGIMDALGGKLSLKGLFNTFGNILKKQFAEQVTYAIFQGASSNQSAVTSQAVNLVTPAAVALAAATDRVTGALGGAANDNAIADAMHEAAGHVGASAQQFSGVLSGAVGPMSEAIRGILGLFGLMGKGSLMGGGGAEPTSGIGKFFSSQGPVSKGLDKIAGFLGVKSKTNADGSVTSAGSSMLGKAASGLAIGSASGQLLGMLGIKTSSTGSALGGLAGSFIGGPLGAAIGGALGGVVGTLFKKISSSNAQVTGGGAGDISANGTNGKLRGAASGAAGSVQQGLADIAKTLNATVGTFSLSIGQWDGKWRVNDQATNKKLNYNNFSEATLHDFGDDAQAAIQYAIETAIKQGAISGLSKGISEALRNGTATVQEVADFAAGKKDIDNKAKALTDPVGAAIDLLDEQFNQLREQYKKFGEDTTNLEKVYQDQRTKTIAEATKNELASIRAFRDELKGGDLGGASLTDQMGFQSKAFKAIEDARASGKSVDYDQVNTVGRALLEATRELEGNTPAYQAQVDRVMALLNGLIDGSGATNVSTLPAPPQIDTTSIVTATDATTQAVQDQTAQLVAAVNNTGAAIVRMSGTLSAKLDAMGRGGYEGNAAYDLERF